MPTLFYTDGFRVCFFSNEHKPIHVHVEKAGGVVKIELLPEIVVIANKGMSAKNRKKALSLVMENKGTIIG
ncbi:DUF4160 domain-containing protein [Sinomicrobium weinanense]|uniref:DUF4160 domain-containing protein n=1 Tax=Sinomicrobium weinanense TaxID=2842200 RepID=A0A926Q2T4_9FLAO|nr:DUF4160 domain-containing protein [Sinomicrobium weinanense]MBC9796972.1 DUF4160 domain-containing protein [Sinomicrobium weinanense]MBU3122189.1 DUF4160 domain-containing protein [Sinomicrobium weinanense]